MIIDKKETNEDFLFRFGLIGRKKTVEEAKIYLAKLESDSRDKLDNENINLIQWTKEKLRYQQLLQDFAKIGNSEQDNHQENLKDKPEKIARRIKKLVTICRETSNKDRTMREKMLVVKDQQLTQEIKTLKDKLHLLEKDKNIILEQLTSELQTIDILARQISLFQKFRSLDKLEMSELFKKNQILEERMTYLEKQNKQMKEEMEVVQSELRNQKNERQSTIMFEQSQFQYLNPTTEGESSQINFALQEQSEKSTNVQSLKKENVCLKIKDINLENSLQILRKQGLSLIENIKIRVLEDMNNLQKQKESSENEQDKICSSILKLQSEFIQQYEYNSSKLLSLSFHLQKKYSEIKRLKLAIQKHKVQIHLLECDKNIILDRLTHSQSEAIKFNQEKSTLEFFLSYERRDLSDLHKKNQLLEEKLESLSNQNRIMSEEIEMLKTLLESLRSGVAEQEHQIKQEKETVQEEKIVRYELMLDEQKKAASALIEEKQALKNKVLHLEAEILKKNEEFAASISQQLKIISNCQIKKKAEQKIMQSLKEHEIVRTSIVSTFSQKLRLLQLSHHKKDEEIDRLKMVIQKIVLQAVQFQSVIYKLESENKEKEDQLQKMFVSQTNVHEKMKEIRELHNIIDSKREEY